MYNWRYFVYLGYFHNSRLACNDTVNIGSPYVYKSSNNVPAIVPCPIFFPEFNIRLWQKLCIRFFFFFLHQNQNIFLEKNHNPPFKLNGRSLKADEIQEFSTVVRPYWCHISYLDPIIMVFLCSHFNIINNQKNHVQQTK